MIVPGRKPLTAVEAKSHAHWIACGPFAFYAALTLRDTGLLAALAEAGRQGMDLSELSARTGISRYGCSVLLDFGLDLALVDQQDGRFRLDKTGQFMLNDEMTRVNMNFTRDVCYQALPQLETSIREQRPAGLATLGPWKTLYEGLTRMPEPAKTSWFEFDHYYSDRMFDALLPIVFEQPVRELLDVGGNTGKWALKCLAHDPNVRVTLMDLPRQLEVARANIEAAGYGDRAGFHACDLLDPAQPFYEGAEVIWMSQFLDCFSEEQIRVILRRAGEALAEDGTLVIVEHFPDRQNFEAARLTLDATSLYFTLIANGNSRMYHSGPFKQLVADAGLKIVRELDDVGVGHTVLCCKRA